MTRGAWRFLFGYVEIEVTASTRRRPPRARPLPARGGAARPARPLAPGPGLEAFLNLAAAAGLTLWRVRRQEGRLRACLSLGEVGPLRHAARRAGCRVRFRRRHGLPFLWRRLRRRRVLLAGAVACALLVYYLAGCIWFIEIHGLEHLSEANLRRELARAGLRPGVRKSAVDLRLLAQRLPLEVPGVAWVGITSYGVKVVLDVVEKDPAAPAADDRPAHVVARRPGVIVQVLALRGQPVVQPGQVVRAGQILIRGEYRPSSPAPGNREQPGAAAGQGRAVAARGRVLARTWYSEYREVALVDTRVVRTGRSLARVVLRIGPWRLPVYWQRGRMGRYEVERRTLMAVPSWREGPPPVELLRETRYEVVIARRLLDLRQAVQEAERQALDRVKRGLPPGSRVVAVQSQVVQRGASFAGVRTTVEVVEDIGIQRPFRVP